MSYTNQTANYGLPQYSADDKPTYLGDFNKAMLDIDTAIKSADTKAEASETLAQNASNSATEALSTANSASTTAGNALTTANNAQTTATNAQTTASGADTKADTAISTANGADTKADTAISTANSADTKADTAISTANSADTKATQNATKINNLGNFSSNETVIGQWVDGKPLYRRVFSQTTKTNIDLSSLDYEFITILDSSLEIADVDPQTKNYVRNPYYTSASDYFDVLINPSEQLTIETSHATIAKWITIILYTKTSDQPIN